MKFSAQEEFGLRCMLALAREGEDGFLTIPVIAKTEGLTQSHVAKLLAVLRKAGYVNSYRGQQGGYTLARPAKEILVADLMAVLGGRLTHDHFCVRFTGQNEECVHSEDCTLLPLWYRIQEAVDGALKGLTLRDLTDPAGGVNVRLFEDPRARTTAGV
jgi:Rrf2 family protein